MSTESYFNAIAARQRRYEQHGLPDCPSEQELAEYAMELADRIDALYAATRYEHYIDHRGRTWARRATGAV